MLFHKIKKTINNHFHQRLKNPDVLILLGKDKGIPQPENLPGEIFSELYFSLKNFFLLISGTTRLTRISPGPKK